MSTLAQTNVGPGQTFQLGTKIFLFGARSTFSSEDKARSQINEILREKYLGQRLDPHMIDAFIKDTLYYYGLAGMYGRISIVLGYNGKIDIELYREYGSGGHSTAVSTVLERTEV